MLAVVMEISRDEHDVKGYGLAIIAFGTPVGMMQDVKLPEMEDVREGMVFEFSLSPYTGKVYDRARNLAETIIKDGRVVSGTPMDDTLQPTTQEEFETLISMAESSVPLWTFILDYHKRHQANPGWLVDMYAEADYQQLAAGRDPKVIEKFIFEMFMPNTQGDEHDHD